MPAAGLGPDGRSDGDARPPARSRLRRVLAREPLPSRIERRSSVPRRGRRTRPGQQPDRDREERRITVGPLAGGLLFPRSGRVAVFGLNAASFLVAAALVAGVRGRFADPKHSVSSGVDDPGGLASGILFIVRERVLRQMLLSLGGVRPRYGLHDRGGTAPRRLVRVRLAGYGALTAFWGGGTIVGAWLSRGVRPERGAVWIVSFSALMALTCFGVALSPSFWLVLVWIAAFGLADGPTQVVEQNLLQRPRRTTCGVG